MTVTWTVLATLEWTTNKFVERNIAGARLEAQLLLAHVLKCTRTQLYMNFDKPLSEEERAAYRGLIQRRLGGEPVAYLLGETEFWSMPFYVDSNVVNGVPNNPDFLGDSGIPAEPGHYSDHPVPGVSGNIQVSFRAAK